MRILVHDFAGHPFQIQLSRCLARRGYTVLHAYCASLPTTPQAALEPQERDPPTLAIEGLRLDRPIRKPMLIERWRLERHYGHLLARTVLAFGPDVVLAANTPLDALARLQHTAAQIGARFVFWVQDLIGMASARLLRQKIPALGHLIGNHYARLEQQLLRQSDAVVLITEDFRDALPAEARDRAHVIPNWAPLDEVPVRPRENPWANAALPTAPHRFIYAGTLGMKHNPDLLLQLALALPERALVIVISEGAGADWLTEQKLRHRAENLLVLPFQPFERLPDVLGAADVLVAVLEPEAGVFSVPSKVLTYLCAARPLLLAVPPENLAARIVLEHGAGRVTHPKDTRAFIAAATELLDQPERRKEMGRRARAYAEREFDIGAVASRFEDVIRGARAAAPATPLSSSPLPAIDA